MCVFNPFYMAQVTGALEAVLQLQAVRYHYRTDEYPTRGLPDSLQMGWLAQDVQGVVPELVQEDGEGKFHQFNVYVLIEFYRYSSEYYFRTFTYFNIFFIYVGYLGVSYAHAAVLVAEAVKEQAQQQKEQWGQQQRELEELRGEVAALREAVRALLAVKAEV
jgi:hypothetical protein